MDTEPNEVGLLFENVKVEIGIFIALIVFIVQYYIKESAKLNRSDVLSGFSNVYVLINPKSGNTVYSSKLYNSLLKILRPTNVIKINFTNLKNSVKSVIDETKPYKVVICGGDGTISYVLDSCCFQGQCEGISIFPIGTGNDLARVLKYTRFNSILELLFEVKKAREIVQLDRFNISVSSDNYSKEYSMNCYMGIGVDAQITLNFHLNRQKSPHLFKSRFVNKLWYATFGGKEIIMQRFLNFYKKVTLICDGVEVKVPVGIEGIIVLNIRSFAAGADLWGDVENQEDVGNYETTLGSKSVPLLRRSNTQTTSSSDIEVMYKSLRKEKSTSTLEQVRIDRRDSNSEPDGGSETFRRQLESERKRFHPCLFNDGRVEVVGVHSSFQLGAAKVGLDRPVRLCQGREVLIKVSNLNDLPMQIDGEPFVLPQKSTQDGVTIKVSFKHQVPILNLDSKKKSSKIKRSQWRKVLRNAKREKLITEEQHYSLVRKFEENQ